MTENKRFTMAVYDKNAINGFTVLDLEKPNSSKRLKYENVYIGSKVGCEIVCSFGNSLVEEKEQLKQSFINLIDKKIEGFQNGDYGDLPCNVIHMFLDLKEEIGELE